MEFSYSIVDKEHGVSRVWITHKNKHYFGEAKLHPEDKWSNLTGCRYAEIRAEIKALKDEWKAKKAACEECRTFVRNVMDRSRFNKDDETAKAMFSELNHRIKEVNKLADQITAKELGLRTQIRKQDELTNKRKIKQNSSKDKE